MRFEVLMNVHGLGRKRGDQKCAFANFLFEGGRCADAPYEVAHFDTNRTPNGVYDLAGNVSEWMAEEYASYPGSNLDVGQGIHLVLCGAEVT